MPRRSMLIDNTCPTEARLVHHLVAWQQWGNLSLQKNITELKFAYAELPEFFQAFVQDSYLLMLIHL